MGEGGGGLGRPSLRRREGPARHEPSPLVGGGQKMPQELGGTRYVGAAIRRKEDPRLITGRGRYVADIRQPGCLEVAFLRSPHAHARLLAVNVSPALAVPGVVAAFSGRDLARLAPDLVRRPMPALADGEVRYVGEPLAMVAARDRYAAEDGLAAIEAMYAPLPAVTDLERALAPDAPPATSADGNLCAEYREGFGDLEAAFRQAEAVVRRELVIHRGSAFPLECRGLLVVPDAASGGLLVWAATQSPHALRDGLAAALGLADH